MLCTKSKRQAASSTADRVKRSQGRPPLSPSQAAAFAGEEQAEMSLILHQLEDIDGKVCQYDVHGEHKLYHPLPRELVHNIDAN